MKSKRYAEAIKGSREGIVEGRTEAEWNLRSIRERAGGKRMLGLVSQLAWATVTKGS